MNRLPVVLQLTGPQECEGNKSSLSSLGAFPTHPVFRACLEAGAKLKTCAKAVLCSWNHLLKLLVQGERAARRAAQVGVKRRPVTGLLHEAKKRPSGDAHPGKSSFQLPHCRQHEPGPACRTSGTHGPCKNGERCPTWGLQYCSPLDGRPASTIH